MTACARAAPRGSELSDAPHDANAVAALDVREGLRVPHRSRDLAAAMRPCDGPKRRAAPSANRFGHHRILSMSRHRPRSARPVAKLKPALADTGCLK